MLNISSSEQRYSVSACSHDLPLSAEWGAPWTKQNTRSGGVGLKPHRGDRLKHEKCFAFQPKAHVQICDAARGALRSSERPFGPENQNARGSPALKTGSHFWHSSCKSAVNRKSFLFWIIYHVGLLGDTLLDKKVWKGNVKQFVCSNFIPWKIRMKSTFSLRGDRHEIH